MYQAENAAQPESSAGRDDVADDHAPTTVGYGDIYPITPWDACSVA